MQYDPSLRPVKQPGQLGDWASVIAIVLFASLWLMWPDTRKPKSGKRPIPEPSCAYGVLSQNFHSAPKFRYINPSDDDKHDIAGDFAQLPKPMVPAIPEIASGIQIPVPLPETNSSNKKFPNRAFELPLPEFPINNPQSVSTGLIVSVSSELSAADFQYELPVITNSAAYTLSASLSFSKSGNVDSFLIDSFSGSPDILLAWRPFLQLAKTSKQTSGTILIEFH